MHVLKKISYRNVHITRFFVIFTNQFGKNCNCSVIFHYEIFSMYAFFFIQENMYCVAISE